MNAMAVWFAVFLCLCCVAGVGRAEELVSVASIGPDGTLVLEDARAVRLSGLFPGDVGSRAGQQALGQLLEGKRVRLGAPSRHDRHGRTIAPLWREDGLSLQRELVAQGRARVALLAESGPDDVSLLAVEEEARHGGRGGWRAQWAVVPSAALSRGQEGFMIVEGTIVEASEWKGTVYLNFGPDWRRAFTAVIPRETVRLFDKAEGAPLSLKGKTVRIRGWLVWKARPEIAIRHPVQIQQVSETVSSE